MAISSIANPFIWVLNESFRSVTVRVISMEFFLVDLVLDKIFVLFGTLYSARNMLFLILIHFKPIPPRTYSPPPPPNTRKIPKKKPFTETCILPRKAKEKKNEREIFIFKTAEEEDSKKAEQVIRKNLKNFAHHDKCDRYGLKGFRGIIFLGFSTPHPGLSLQEVQTGKEEYKNGPEVFRVFCVMELKRWRSMMTSCGFDR
ncbi:hypothetical protein CDAR_250551 [Caerostris darwini]|uniref:Uncharacterized protein n=1 Tax=Caerostris darwini TaxID=1538125 RepID=A0AAV4UED8_9ARAC|nr:hypothetical protein CDAR_250551 [Caerostris darwini]